MRPSPPPPAPVPRGKHSFRPRNAPSEGGKSVFRAGLDAAGDAASRWGHGDRGAPGHRLRGRRRARRPQAAGRERLLVPELPPPGAEHRALAGPARGERVRELVAEDPPPGVLAYEDGSRWGGPPCTRGRTRRSRPTAASRTSTTCPSGRCGASGSARATAGRASPTTSSRGAVEFAREHGAPVVEAYPVDNGGERVDLTMAYVGTRSLFEARTGSPSRRRRRRRSPGSRGCWCGATCADGFPHDARHDPCAPPDPQSRVASTFAANAAARSRSASRRWEMLRPGSGLSVGVARRTRTLSAHARSEHR